MPPTDCTLLAVFSPTEFAEYTEPFCCIFSHRLHRFSQMLLSGGALVSSAPTCSVVALLALLVHFLLWQAAKPSGDKCTP